LEVVVTDPIHAPELRGATAWLNAREPLSLRSLRGKVVLLDFWTYGCINCLHVLPELQRLERKYRDELVVIGVHSPKFENEKDVAQLRRTLDRLGIDHPVAQDADFRIWREYTVRAWPTLVLIDPAGYVVAAVAGEGHTAELDQVIAAVVAVFDERGEMNREPVAAIAPEPRAAARAGGDALRYPGAVLADPAKARLFIADSGHHRVLICGLDGAVRDAIGSDAAGFANGAFEDAELDSPQGLALSGDTLFVADRGTHTIRAADLIERRVRTVAGTGEQGSWGGEGGAARETPLVSPWGLAVWKGLLFVGMAGVHQIWMIDVARGLAWPYAGTGAEARVDGPIAEAAFTQPSGLALAGDTLYVADAEGNIVRRVDLPPANTVTTLAGGNLFDFGDRDGAGDAVRLQHPIGIATDGARVYVSDTYNHRIKILDPKTRSMAALAGTGTAGSADGRLDRAQFDEPAGLALAGRTLYVADTNNHAVRVVDLEARTVTTLAVRGL
jgi:thiol-disulfide isomerase/thioredoxin/DNA-binding beta-propeller fold protein YncE